MSAPVLLMASATVWPLLQPQQFIPQTGLVSFHGSGCREVTLGARLAGSQPRPCFSPSSSLAHGGRSLTGPPATLSSGPVSGKCQWHLSHADGTSKLPLWLAPVGKFDQPDGGSSTSLKLLAEVCAPTTLLLIGWAFSSHEWPLVNQVTSLADVPQAPEARSAPPRGPSVRPTRSSTSNEALSGLWSRRLTLSCPSCHLAMPSQSVLATAKSDPSATALAMCL